MGPTHRLIGGSTVLVATTAIGLPLELVAGASALAVASSSLPDDLEKVFHLEHRKITHRPVLQLLACSALAYAAVLSTIPLWIVLCTAIPVAAACLLHSFADAMTVYPSGIQLLWPISRRGYHLMPYRMRVRVGTRSPSEVVFALIWSVIVLSYLYARFRHHIVA